MLYKNAPFRGIFIFLSRQNRLRPETGPQSSGKELTPVRIRSVSDIELYKKSDAWLDLIPQDTRRIPPSPDD